MMGKKTGVANGGKIEMVFLPPIETKDADLMELLNRMRSLIAEELAVKN